MNSYKRARIIVFLFIALIGISCSQGSTQNGYIYPFTANTTAPVGTTTVGVRQRPDIVTTVLAEDYKLDELINQYSAPFSVWDLAPGKFFIYETYGSFQRTISFPMEQRGDKVVLGGMDTMTFTALLASVTQSPYNLTVNSTLGIVAAAPNPLSLSEEVCGPTVNDVLLLDKETETQVGGSVSRFTFTKSGSVSLSYSAQYSNFIFFNVAEGSYKLRYSTVDPTVKYLIEVVVVAGQISFGYQMPCQLFGDFRKVIR